MNIPTPTHTSDIQPHHQHGEVLPFPRSTPVLVGMDAPTPETHVLYVLCAACQSNTPVNEITPVHGHGGWCWTCCETARDGDA